MVDLCKVVLRRSEDVSNVRIRSDVQLYVQHPSPFLPSPSPAFDTFPLEGAGPFMCSQGVNGGLTVRVDDYYFLTLIVFAQHFAHCSTFHAIDIACPPSTPIISICDGVVTEVTDQNSVIGIHVDNLFKWNSITVKSERGELVEYVHIQHESSLVKAGDRVHQGQRLCLSGEVGFCPSPHLHIEVHMSPERDAPSVPFRVKCNNGSYHAFEQLQWYSPSTETALTVQE